MCGWCRKHEGLIYSDIQWCIVACPDKQMPRIQRSLKCSTIDRLRRNTSLGAIIDVNVGANGASERYLVCTRRCGMHRIALAIFSRRLCVRVQRSLVHSFRMRRPFYDGDKLLDCAQFMLIYYYESARLHSQLGRRSSGIGFESWDAPLKT